MKRKAILILLCLVAFRINAESQSSQAKEQVTDEAEYIKGDLKGILDGIVKYPELGVTKNIQGDVVVSCIITADGKIAGIVLVSTPDIILSASSLVAINSLSEGWKPATINNAPVDRNYKAVFRYRIYVNSQPADYKSSAAKAAGKAKFEKALEQYNRAIMDNPYDYELFEGRSKVKASLDDTKGAEKDMDEARKLKGEILFFVDATAFGLPGSERKPVTIERVIRSEIIVK